MSQATFDQAAQGGSPDDSSETRSATAKTRRRPTHRGRGAKSVEATTATPAAVAAPVATVSETPTTEEQPARAESRASRGRGGAKRPAARGKTGAQLIINKPASESLPDIALESTPVEATPEAAAEPAGEPVIIPVVTAEAETPRTPQASAPLKTRFGQPRRPRQPPAATPALAAEALAQPTEAPAADAESPAAEVIAPASTTRYRFDRSRSASQSISPARPERLSGGLYTSGAAQPAETQEETPAAEPSEPPFALPSLEGLTSATDELPTLAFGEPAAEETAPAEASQEPMEGAESADGAGAASRRRRRRRRPNAHNGAHSAEMDEAAEEEDESAEPEAESPEAPTYAAEPEELPQPEPPRETRATHGESLRSRTGRFGLPSRVTRRTPVAPIAPTWEAPQPAAETSPYGSPEPASARGFGPTPAGVATPAREVYPRPGRIERGESAAQLGAVIREAINTQTDRLLSELRRQQPPAVTLSIPNTQTAERVGVFVDVANVIYSARNLRTSVDFGQLLDFLRANRRLTRAQAYAPTDPMPGAEQAFLSAVRGLGYRITTKNYKTFSNGAKKADLDLDLCMDIVRMVDAKAVDTIVLVSGDSDFLPLLDYCSDHGVRVEVAAFDDAASMILRQSCDLFVNLSLVEGIRG